MNLRRKAPHDSLYLLLDTLCNAFGGIILLAVLVVLLTSKEKQQTSPRAESQEMVQRRMALAQTNLQASLQLNQSLQAKANDGRWKQQLALIATRQQLKDSLQQIRDDIAHNNQELEAANAADPAERLKFLKSELASAQARELDAKNSLAATQDNNKRLKARLADMQKQLTAKLNDLERPLRLPREHDTGKHVVWLIARYGHIYPCRNPDFSRNESDITWSALLDLEIAEPIRGRGIDPFVNPQGMNNYFNQMAGEDVYFAFNVFEDSFPAFLQAKQMLLQDGLPYGLDFQLIAEGPLRFSHGSGYTPKPQ